MLKFVVSVYDLGKLPGDIIDQNVVNRIPGRMSSTFNSKATADQRERYDIFGETNSQNYGRLVIFNLKKGQLAKQFKDYKSCELKAFHLLKVQQIRIL